MAKPERHNGWKAQASRHARLPLRVLGHMRLWLGRKPRTALHSAQARLTAFRHHDGFREMAFTFAVIGLAAKIATADGEATREEFMAFCEAFPMPAGEHEKIQRLFIMAQRDEAEAVHHARRIAALFPLAQHRALLRDVLSRLAQVAAADAVLSDRESALLLAVGQAFGLRKREAARLIHAPQAASQDSDPYVVLGVRREASEADIRRNYHRLLREKHPDSVLAQGGSKDAVLIASRQVAQLNAAYQAIRAERR